LRPPTSPAPTCPATSTPTTPASTGATYKDAGHNFAFVKSTEGTGYVNPYFNSDWNAIKANDMVRGSYHYAKPDGSPTSAAEQARYFVSVAGTMQANPGLSRVS